MAHTRSGTRKPFELNVARVKRVQKIFRTKTESEAVEQALDFAIEEYEKNEVAAAANEKFVGSGVEIKDVYGKLFY